MSEVFQAVLFRGTHADLDRWVGSIEVGTLVVALANGLTAVSPPLGPGRSVDALIGGNLAMSISRSAGLALHVILDTRAGYRHSQVFRQGQPRRAFNCDAETWHRLDDHGAPIPGVTYTLGEHVAGEEYETADDAITQGLRAAGFEAHRTELVEAVCYGASEA